MGVTLRPFAPLAAALGALSLAFAAQEPRPDGAAVADRLAELFESDAPDDALAGRYNEAFEAFIDRLELAHDGERAVRIARSMHGRARALWSAFCLEGALRRSAALGDGPESANYEEADAALVTLLSTPGALTDAERVDVIQRRAILAAGFGATHEEQRALGRAIALGGTDGFQISGLAALTRGDDVEAAKLFGALLDRRRAVGAPIDEAPAWALRGHGLASLARLTKSSPSAGSD